MVDPTRISKVLVIIMLLVLTACAGHRMGGKPASGVYHSVKKGDTLSRIARAYKIDVQLITEANYLKNDEVLEVGQVLFIPGAGEVVVNIAADRSDGATVEAAVKKNNELRKEGQRQENKSDRPGAGESASSGRAADEKTPRGGDAAQRLPQAFIAPSKQDEKKSPPRSSLRDVSDRKEKSVVKPFIWPVTGKVLSRFGAQPNGMHFNGIKIEAPEGAAVLAAADGIVIFSALLKDYGETIILKHEGEYATVYSYLGERSVKRADRLKRGDRIAVLPKPKTKGHALMYFEIRHKNQARNPLSFLP